MWRLENTNAEFESDGLCGMVRTSEPTSGIDQLAWTGAALPNWSLLEILAPVRRWNDAISLEETYVRGSDCVATYRQVTGPNVQPQIYWRLLHAPTTVAAGMEVLLSLRTSLLDSRPESAIRGTLSDPAEFLVRNAAGEYVTPQIETSAGRKICRDSCGTILIRPRGREFSYAEFVSPEDFSELALEPTVHTGGWRWEFSLLREHLEKGVIRRGRIQAWFLPRANDVQTVTQLRDSFLNSPPPLTT